MLVKSIKKMRTQSFEFDAPKMVCKSSSENIVMSLLNVRSLKNIVLILKVTVK